MKGASGEDPERKDEIYGESFSLLKEYLSYLEQNLVGIWKLKAILTHPNEECVIGQWRKGQMCYKVAKILAELCSCPGVHRG